MWVNINHGFQVNQSELNLINNGLFYGTYCSAGQYVKYFSCKICPSGTFSTLGDLSCQPCPLQSDYLINFDSSGNQNINECFLEP